MKIYPIPCHLKSATDDKPGNILSISHQGIVVDSLETPLLVNRTYTIQFNFPLLNEAGETLAVVSRTYVKIKERKSQKRIHMNELIFKNPSTKFKKFLVNFLAQVANSNSV